MSSASCLLVEVHSNQDYSSVSRSACIGRKFDPFELILKGELDWIVMKALEKDRNRRFESASEFAQDIRNFMEGEAVNARPPSTAYQIRKFAGKHKGVLGSVAAIGLMLVSAVAVSSWFAFTADRTRIEAETERTIARENEQKTVAALVHILNDFDTFKGLPNEEIVEVSKLMELREFARGADIYKQGTLLDDFFIIVRGNCDVMIDEKIVNEISFGESVGEVALYKKEPATSTIRAKTKVVCFAINRDEYRAILDR